MKSAETVEDVSTGSNGIFFIVEDNLNRLLEAGILQAFVEENNGAWDHQKWLELCDKIKKKGFTPIAFDRVGLMLEDIKSRYDDLSWAVESCANLRNIIMKGNQTNDNSNCFNK